MLARKPLRGLAHHLALVRATDSAVPLKGLEAYPEVYARSTSERFTTMLQGEGPVFIGRIGGSDYEVVKEHFLDRRRLHPQLDHARAMRTVQEYNGYFDFDHDMDRFVRFLEDMESFYRNADSLMYAGPALIPRFAGSAFPRGDARFLRRICAGKVLFNYTFVEAVMPFLESFSRWGAGKRILVVSPFSESVRHQYGRLDDLIADYCYPDFELLTYTTPVTYSVPDDTPATLRVSTRSWHEEAARMAEGIAALDFDIALLSCGSYSMYLGDRIRHSMGRSAIYIGGMLNVFFNIYGQRYDTNFFNQYMRADTQVNAFENAEVARLRAGRGRENEALRAYFGHRRAKGTANPEPGERS